MTWIELKCGTHNYPDVNKKWLSMENNDKLTRFGFAFKNTIETSLSYTLVIFSKILGNSLLCFIIFLLILVQSVDLLSTYILRLDNISSVDSK